MSGENNGKELKSCFGQVFSFDFNCFCYEYLLAPRVFFFSFVPTNVAPNARSLAWIMFFVGYFIWEVCISRWSRTYSQLPSYLTPLAPRVENL